jgi:hypothetical protein
MTSIENESFWLHIVPKAVTISDVQMFRSTETILQFVGAIGLNIFEDVWRSIRQVKINLKSSISSGCLSVKASVIRAYLIIANRNTVEEMNRMKSKLFWSCCTVLVASLPIPSLAQSAPQAGIDYKGGSMKYQLVPGKIPERTLPKAFDFPIITNVATDTSITSDHLITDQFRPPAVPQGLTADDVPRIRSEYTRALITWSESIKECLGKQPRLIRASTKNPIQINGKVGTIVRNANNRAVCK